MTCAVELRCHTRYMAYGPIAFGVRMVADTATHQAVNGILDRALEVVLMRRDDGLRSRTLRLADAMRHDDQLDGPPVRVWIEPLSMAAEHIDSHLVGLAS